MLVESGVSTEKVDLQRLQEIMDLLEERIALIERDPDSVGYSTAARRLDEPSSRNSSAEFAAENFHESSNANGLPEWTEP